jgi:hypothetical protein
VFEPIIGLLLGLMEVAVWAVGHLLSQSIFQNGAYNKGLSVTVLQQYLTKKFQKGVYRKKLSWLF